MSFLKLFWSYNIKHNLIFHNHFQCTKYDHCENEVLVDLLAYMCLEYLITMTDNAPRWWLRNTIATLLWLQCVSLHFSMDNFSRRNTSCLYIVLMFSRTWINSGESWILTHILCYLWFSHRSLILQRITPSRLRETCPRLPTFIIELGKHHFLVIVLLKQDQERSDHHWLSRAITNVGLQWIKR